MQREEAVFTSHLSGVYAFLVRLSLSKAFFESQSQDSSRRKYSAAAPLIPISEQGVVLLTSTMSEGIFQP